MCNPQVKKLEDAQLNRFKGCLLKKNAFPQSIYVHIDEHITLSYEFRGPTQQQKTF